MVRNLAGATALAAVLGLASLTSACATAASAPAPEMAEERPAPTIDQAALDGLSRMSSYLRTLQAFEVTANTEIDEVMEDGQKLQFGGVTTYKIARPDGFMVQIVGDRKVRQIIYDGKTLTVAAPRMGVYAQVAAPATISEVLALAEEKYAIEIPLADLFRWGTEQIPADAIQGAKVIGYANVNGVDADQYAFRGAEVDWQVWIARGSKPFPVKVVITSYNEDESPQYTAELAWKTPKGFAAGTFTFKPPADAVRITVAEAVESTTEGK